MTCSFWFEGMDASEYLEAYAMGQWQLLGTGCVTEYSAGTLGFTAMTMNLRDACDPEANTASMWSGAVAAGPQSWLEALAHRLLTPEHMTRRRAEHVAKDLLWGRR